MAGKFDFSSAKVHKFGGASLTAPEQFQACLNHIGSEPTLIVISAIEGTTQTLQTCLDCAKNKEDFQTPLQHCIDKHLEWITLLLDSERLQQCKQTLLQDGQNIHDTLHAIQLVGTYSPQAQDLILSFGERWSAQILTAVLQKMRACAYIDAFDLLYTEQKRQQTWIDWQKSQRAWQQICIDNPVDCFIVTGFIARNEENQRITLGLNGSDYSAAVIAKLVGAKQLMIWKDVDGIYTADPRRVRSAFPIPMLSYESALELAYFGASVLHPRAIAPVMSAKIPVTIKNFNKPEQPGTTICANADKLSTPVQGLTSIEDIAVITIEGSGMIGVSGTAARVFSTLQQDNISVILISQASSEHSICFAIEQQFAERAVKILREQFEFELQQGLVEKIKADLNCAILAAVGDGMVGTIGISGKLCSTLAKANVNIRAIAQGSSERNISVVVAKDDIQRALRAVHSGFYLSRKTLSVGVIGPGVVGKTLLQQIHDEAQHLRDEAKVNILIRGIANSKKMLLQHSGIDLANWQQQFEQQAKLGDLSQFCDFIVADDIPHAVIIDCSASQTVADYYPQFIRKGAHVITPNKRAGSGPIDQYRALHQLTKDYNRYFLYETTVCAGLPVMTTIKDIQQTGDKILQIQGIVSGTLGYIFHQCRQGLPFSQIIHTAKDAGYTEPDPRDDLSGMDVARKIVILAREMGLPASLDDVKVENLVPEPLRDVSLDEFMRKLGDYDDAMQAHLQSLTQNDEVCAYVGCIDRDGTIQVGIQAFAPSHPFANLQGTDNMLIFKTQRYFDNPLVIQGPGAGAEVTAAGVFADLLRASTMIAN